MSMEQLERHFRRISHLSHVSAIMQWDEAVMMPLAAGAERAAALLHRAEIQVALGDGAHAGLVLELA